MKKTHTIEPAGALPSYDVKDLVVFLPEDTQSEIVCEVVGHKNTSIELLYRLKDPLSGQDYLASFRCLQPHIDVDLDDDFDDRYVTALQDFTGLDPSFGFGEYL